MSRTIREPGYYRHLDSGSDNEFYEIDRVVAKKVEKVSFIACITIAMYLNAYMILKGEQSVSNMERLPHPCCLLGTLRICYLSCFKVG